MSIEYTVVGNRSGTVVSAFIDGKAYAATSQTHPNINTIVRLLQDDDESVLALFDPSEQIVQAFEKLSHRVSISGDTVYLDGDPAPEAISEAIVRFYRAGLAFDPLVKFLDKLAGNPSPHSVEQLYPWLQAHEDSFTINHDGDLVAYKGVEETEPGVFLSISSGKANVNGEVKTGRIEQRLGDEVDMPRSEVQFNPSVGCSTGLHAGTWEYASMFGRGTVLEVTIDPADVVSVPTDCYSQKLRTRRYVVADVLDAPHNTPVVGFEVEASVDDGDWWGEYEFEEAFEFAW